MKIIWLAAVFTLSQAHADPALLKSKFPVDAQAQSQIVQTLKARFDESQYRAVKAQVIYDDKGVRPDHLLVYLLIKGVHRVDFARINLTSNFAAASSVRPYKLEASDFRQQPDASSAPVCPDVSTQFIAMAPNDDEIEQSVTVQVAQAAEAAGLKTARLLEKDATRAAYLNYMSCPNLIGNFYDGDANTGEMVTVDGVISSDDFSSLLKGAFRYKVTNIWLACEAYNDPMLSAVEDDAQSQKYAAGINDLSVGPSDQAGACAMEGAIAGKPMTAAFQACYKQLDNSSDEWGFGGSGSDLFGH